MSTVLNRLRISCADSDRGGLHLKSNIDNTYRLDGRTDEDLSFTDTDLVVLQNKLERACEITFKAIALKDGRRAWLKPSRQPSFTLVDESVSVLRCQRGLVLGPGESCVIHSSEWSPRAGVGARIPV